MNTTVPSTAVLGHQILTGGLFLHFDCYVTIGDALVIKKSKMYFFVHDRCELLINSPINECTFHLHVYHLNKPKKLTTDL